MFDTMMISKRIRQVRIGKNMTQMALADAMGVSYQAVSNWERGNSMPDISKLGDLCEVLGMTVNQLLGLEETASNPVVKAMEHQELTVEELAEVAPMLPPDTVQANMENRDKNQKMDLSKIVSLAPFLDQEYLDQLVADAEPEDMDDLAAIAPFLGAETLDKLANRCTAAGDFDALVALAPFVRETTLDRLAESVQPDDIGGLIGLAPFLSDKTLDSMVLRCEAAGNLEDLEELAPFISEGTLDALTDRWISGGGKDSLDGLYPFMGKQTLRKLAQYLMERKDLEGLEDLMPFE